MDVRIVKALQCTCVREHNRIRTAFKQSTRQRRIESEGISSIVRSAGLPGYTLDVVTVLGKHPAIGVEQLVSFVVWDQSASVAVRKSVEAPGSA